MPQFACTATCMDGRIQAAVRKHLKAEYGVDWVDIIAQPGMNKFLAENSIHAFWIRLIIYCLTLQLKKVRNLIVMANIRKMIGISVFNHNAKVLTIVGHPLCAGNTCGKEEQIEQLKAAKKTAESFGFETKIILLWVREDWRTVEVINPNGLVAAICHYNVYTAQ